MRVFFIILFSFVAMFACSSYTGGGDDDDDDKKGSYKKSDDDDNGNGGGNGKNDAYLEVNTNRSLSFTCTKPEDLEKTQVINNAITLKFKTKKSNCTIFAKVSNYTVPRGGNTSIIPLELQHSSNNSSNVSSLITRPIQLTRYDQKLFVQPKKSQTFQFRYDLRLMPLGYESPSGRYNFTILFTMTQP